MPLDEEECSTTESIEQSWAREADERLRQVDEGTVELLDADEVLREMRSICR